jgi:hypothetical protein
MFVQRVLTRYPLASGGAVRPGTTGLQFSAAGSAVFTTALRDATGALVAGDVCTMTAIAGQEIETGPLFSVATLPSLTLGIVGR